MSAYSIVEYLGITDGGHCGYCKSENGEKLNAGFWAHTLSCADYEKLLDRGCRRSGKYVYKPILDKTCCPQYTIRLNVHDFVLSKSQKEVLRRLNDFLINDRRGKAIVEESSSKATTKCREKKMAKEKPAKNSEGIEKKDRSRKKKVVRRERALQRLREKGIDIEKFQEERRLKEARRQKRLEDFFLEYDESTWKHCLEVRTVAVASDSFERTLPESFALFKRYQESIHNDLDKSERGYRRFLADSPLFTRDENARVQLGSFHQQYLLDGRLIAVGVVDVLPHCLSGKYFYYDPDYAFLSLGTYSALREIWYTRRLSEQCSQLKYYYMGYYIHSCPKMRYKGRFRPSDLLCDVTRTWVPLSHCTSLLDSCKFTRFAGDDIASAMTIPIDVVRCLHRGEVLDYGRFRLLRQADGTDMDEEVGEYAKVVGDVARTMLLYRS